MRSMIPPIRGAMIAALAAVAPRRQVEASFRQRSATIATRELQAQLRPATLKRHGQFNPAADEKRRSHQRSDNPFSPPQASDAGAAMVAALIVGLVLVAIVVCGLASMGALQ